MRASIDYRISWAGAAGRRLIVLCVLALGLPGELARGQSSAIHGSVVVGSKTECEKRVAKVVGTSIKLHYREQNDKWTSDDVTTDAKGDFDTRKEVPLHDRIYLF